MIYLVMSPASILIIHELLTRFHGFDLVLYHTHPVSRHSIDPGRSSVVNALESQKFTCRLLYFASRHGVGQNNSYWLVFVLECMSYLPYRLNVQGSLVDSQWRHLRIAQKDNATVPFREPTRVGHHF